jgi:hypothetical protein
LRRKDYQMSRGVGNIEHEAPARFEAIASAAPVCIDNFKPQELGNTAWSFATLNHEAPELFDAIARAAQVQINEFNPQNLATMAWAYAIRLLCLTVIATAAPVRIHEFNAQNLSNTAWGLAKMNHKAPLLFDVIAQAAQAQINEYSQQALSETSWAFITMNHEAARSVFDAATARAEPIRIKEFNPQSHPTTSWTFGTLKHKASSLLEAMAQVSTSTGLEVLAMEGLKLILSAPCWEWKRNRQRVHQGEDERRGATISNNLPNLLDEGRLCLCKLVLE